MMMVWSKASALGLVVGGIGMAGMVALVPQQARAGIPECGNIRIEADAQCRLELGGECGAKCSLGIYEKACATHQYESCKETCILPPEPECTDECTVSCADQCEVGIEVVCHQSCFPECVDACAASCDEADDTIQCRASCEATCDGECDHQCAQLPVDASCYSHCLECCGGSCNASANMDCQVTCQDETWEECEYEFRASCEGSCDVEGALFCDGQLIIAGAELHACVGALVERGIELLGIQDEVEEIEEELEELEEDLEEWEEGVNDSLDPVMSCDCRSGGGGRSAGWMVLGLLGLLGLRRRRS